MKRRHYFSNETSSVSIALLTGAFLFATHPLSAGPIQLLSARDPSVALPVGGNGNSVAPQISGDGRFILFGSSANDLVAGDVGQLGLDLFLYDRVSNITVVVSANLNGASGGNGNSVLGTVSTNGRYVAFESDASDLVPADTNGVNDIFVRDLVSRTTELVSVPIDGGTANGSSSNAVMTPDGHYIAFVSAATNLVVNDTNQSPDVFVRDRLSGTTTLASVGATYNPTNFMSWLAITPDGRYVVFCSNARGLAPGIPTNPAGEVYVRDLVSNVTIWASTNASALVSTNLHLNGMASSHPALSDDGRYIAFKSGWTYGTAVPGGGIPAALILRYDTTTRLTDVIETNGYPTWLWNDDPYGPEMSPDGRFIAYARREIAGTKTNSSVQLWDAQTGTNILVSATTDGGLDTNAIAHTPALSPDGRYVAFLGNGANLVGNAVSNGFHIYLRDVLSGTTELLDVDTNGIGSTDNQGAEPTLSADGRFVAFSSFDGDLVSSDNNSFYDVFLRDRIGASTELISRRDPTVISQTGNGLSSISPLSVSADGRWAVVSSLASDLVPGDTNESYDVFIRDLFAGTNALLSAGTNGLPALGGSSHSAVISADGRFVAFVSSATNLVAAPTYASPLMARNNIFVRDLQAGTNVMVSVSGGVPGNNDSSAPVISQDGRYVTFVSSASNLGGSPGVFRVDVTSGTIARAPSSAVTGSLPSMSLDGRFVAYPGAGVQPQVLVWDAQNSSNAFTSPGGATSGALSPTGNQLLYLLSGRIYAVDLATKSILVSFDSKVPIRSSALWSTNGRFFTFVTASNAVPADSNGTNDVYLYDLLGSTLTLVSVNSNLTGSADGPSDAPAVSGDGRFVIFRTFASNVVAGVTSPPPNIYLYDRLSGSNTLLSSSESISSWTTWVSRPAISGNGRSVAFESWAPGLAQPDLNRARDVFASLVDAAVDSDGDGIPDAWMIEHFGHPTGQAGDLSRAGDDADGDGMTNLAEYIAGTDPNSAASVLGIQISVAASPDSVTVTWPAAPGRVYRVQFKDNLTDPEWLEAGGSVVVNGGQAQFTTSTAQPQRFYRVIATQ